jgi:hypothetical protein
MQCQETLLNTINTTNTKLHCDRRGGAITVLSILSFIAICVAFNSGLTLGCKVSGVISEKSFPDGHPIDYDYASYLSVFGNSFIFAPNSLVTYTGLCVDPTTGYSLRGLFAPNKSKCVDSAVRAQNGFFSVVDTNLSICGGYITDDIPFDPSFALASNNSYANR